jgi:hypothetical protein
MATTTETRYVDDLDGSTDNVNTRRFSLDGVAYEIDLAEHNIETLRKALRPYLAVARRLPKTSRLTSTVTATSHARVTRKTAPEAKIIRSWWKANQKKAKLPPLRTHGVIPTVVRDAYSKRAGNPGTGA